MQIVKYAIAAIAGGLIVCLVFFLEKEHAYISSIDKENRMVASIVWKRSFPYLGIDGNLVVETFDGKRLLDKNLVSARDAVEDIAVEFPEITFRSGVVYLSSAKNHYKGPDSFALPVAEQ